MQVVYYRCNNIYYTIEPIYSSANTDMLLNIVPLSICDWIYKNHPYWHILYFKKYHFEMLKQLWLSCATQPATQALLYK